MNRLLVLTMLLLFVEAPRAEDRTTSGTKPAGRVAILRDDLPTSPATASPDYLSQIPQRVGIETTFMNCSEFGNSNTFNHDRFDVVILPYGPSFPVKAADNFRQFLREGGKFFSTGGYAFDNLLERTTNGWQRPKPPALPDVSQVLWRYRIPAEEIRDRGKLTFSGFLKAQNVRGSGMAYILPQVLPGVTQPAEKSLAD